jgi:hypothetical protein
VGVARVNTCESILQCPPEEMCSPSLNAQSQSPAALLSFKFQSDSEWSNSYSAAMLSHVGRQTPYDGDELTSPSSQPRYPKIPCPLL